ncbi:MAG: hypothetical protein ACAH88_07625 [Roseimicrobium sp.]
MAVLEAEIAHGLDCEWNYPIEIEEMEPQMEWLLQHLPGTSLKSVRLDYTMSRPAELGKALKVVGAPSVISAQRGNSPDALVDFLEGLAPNSSLEQLYIFNVSLPDTVCPVLGGYGNLKALAIVPWDISGENFPILKRLESLDLNSSPITNAGLERILQLPSLSGLSIESDHLTLDGIRNMKVLNSNLKDINIPIISFSTPDTVAAEEALRRNCPHASIDVSN